MTEAEQRLAECQEAIRRVLLKGQRFRKGDREVQLPELASLRLLEVQLTNEVAAEKARLSGRARSRVKFTRI